MALNGQFAASNDWDVTRAGNVRQTVRNFAWLSNNGSDTPRLLVCEYPPGSGIEHLDEISLFFGGVTPKGEERVSIGESFYKQREIWPSAEPWDTVWAINEGDTVDIGGINSEGEEEYYWSNYQAVSSQDFVCRYNDYNIPNPGTGTIDEPHRPLYIDIVQQVFTWSNEILENVVLWTYYVTPKEFDIESMHITIRMRTGIGPQDLDPEDDDLSRYFHDRKLIVSEDFPGGSDGTTESVFGLKMLEPEGVNYSDDMVNFYWQPQKYQAHPDRDIFNDIMLFRGITEDQQRGYSQIRTWYTLGPFDIKKGDTVVFRMAEILGDEVGELKEKAEVLDELAKKDFRFPSPPPTPEFRVETQSKQARLIWEPTIEDYEDPYRADNETQPFAGYRIYKSTQGPDGPWTPLAQFDIEGDGYGLDNGLKHEYTDTGILDNITYYYTITGFSKPDTVFPWPSEESSLALNAQEVLPGSGSAESVGKVAVVPNPYRGDINYYEYNPPWEQAPPGRPWMKQDRRIQFINLPSDCIIKVYSASGDFIKEIEHHDPTRGFEDWNLTSYVDQAIASGLYFFSVEDLNTGNTQVGKFVIIK